MAVDQLPARVREFANYLDGLLARLDQGGGWCGIFWQRDPEGMRACLDGRETPPWDVLEALLQDLAAVYGPAAAAAERARARTLYTAAVAAHDARPGARDALADRLDAMLREQHRAAERRARLHRLLPAAASPQEAETLRRDLAWAHDDHERATARCTELHARIADLDRRTDSGATPRDRSAGGTVAGHGAGRDPMGEEAPGSGAQGPGNGSETDAPRGIERPGGERVDRPWHPAAPQAGPAPHAGPASHGGPVPHAGPVTHASPASHPAAQPPDPNTDPTPAAAHPGSGSSPSLGAASGQDSDPARAQAAVPAAEPPPAKARKRRRGSARFAGMIEDAEVPVVVPQAPAAGPEGGARRRVPRGARFAGAGEDGGAAEAPVEVVDAGAGAAVAGAVERLARLRAEGRSGEAHVLLAEITRWPAARFPPLADALRGAGLGADWATLLWEAAALPAERLVAAAGALEAAGMAVDGERMLRQGVARPPGEIGAAVLALEAAGRAREVRALLDAYVAVRTPEEAARSAAAGPGRLVPLLLEAARRVSEERHWDLVHALRVAGFTA
ncbi:hypothetical protein [Streptomyces bungoensis]|uniref:hypothetical protein n=1 Tax=Streptomyces bungoensis TaxID=285568 RepID=UPI003418C817